MTVFRADAAPILRPEDVWALLVEPALEIAIASDVTRTVRMSSPSIRVPRVTSDPEAAWVAEGAEIPHGQPQWDDVDLYAEKLALLSSITNEAARDSSPAAQDEIGRSLGRALARKLDTTLVSGGHVVDGATVREIVGLAQVAATDLPGGTLGGGTAFEPSDWLNAQAVAESRGVRITSWVMNPSTKVDVLVSSLQITDASQLVGVEPSNSGRAGILGSSIITHPAVPLGTVYGVPSERVILGIRDEAEIDFDGSVYFSSWRTAVRAVMRAAFGWTDPAAVVRIRLDSVVDATGATAGSPGTYTPTGAQPPADMAALAAVEATPATAWTEGQHIVLANGRVVHWNGTAWVDGPAPA